MNNEIKEILDFIKEQIEEETLNYEPDVELSKEEAKQLLDYITNLQEELEEQKRIEQASLDTINNLQEEKERLKKENKRIFSKVNDDELLISNAMNYAEAQDYKSRCEKAIDIYLKELNKCNKNGTYVSKVAVDMFNVLEGNNETKKEC